MAALEGLFKKTLSLQFTPVFTDYCGHYRLHRLSLFTTVITVYMLSLYFTVGFTSMSTHMDCMGSQEDIFSGCMVVRSAHGLSCSASFRGSNENLKGMPVKRNTVRAADFTRQANASDKFLSNVMTLPSFSNIEKMQFEKLQTLVSNMSCNEEQSAKVAEVVGKLKHFQKKHVEALLELLAKQCLEVIPDKLVKPIRGPSGEGQDYGSLHRYLTKKVWKELQAPDLCSRCHALCSLASALGLRSPTERTLGTMICLMHWKEWNDGMPSSMEKYQTLQADKPLTRAVLKEYTSMKQLKDPMDQLPPVPADLPASHAMVYTEEILVGKECFEWGCYIRYNLIIQLYTSIHVMFILCCLLGFQKSAIYDCYGIIYTYVKSGVSSWFSKVWPAKEAIDSLCKVGGDCAHLPSTQISCWCEPKMWKCFQKCVHTLV